MTATATASPSTPDDRAFVARHDQLTDLLRFFPQDIKGKKACGRKVYPHHAIIYWPHFAAAMRRSTVWRDRFAPPGPLEEDRKRRGVPTNGAAHTTWFVKALRRHVEDLLSPLVIPTTSTVGGDYVTYSIDLRGYREDRVDVVNPDEWSSLNDAGNYTFFKRITTKRGHVRRTMLTPPPLEDFKVHMAAVPQEIVALYFAWRTVTMRAQAPYDPAEIGVEWLDSGMLFINWQKLFDSPFKPPVTISGMPTSACIAFAKSTK